MLLGEFRSFIRSKIINNKGEFYYLLAQYSTPVVGFLVSIISMRYIEPTTLGAYKSVFIYTSYFSFLQLGVFNGLNRNLSYYRGQGNLEKLRDAAATVFVFSIGIAITSLVIVGILYNTSLNDGSYITLLAFIYMGLHLFINPIKTFLDALYRTGLDFQSLGKIIGRENAAYLLLSILIAFFGFLGYVIQNIVKICFGFVLRLRGKLDFLKWRWNFVLIKEQINVGFLIMLNAYLNTTFFIFDEFYIARNFDNQTLGLFNLARLVLFIVPIIPNSLTTIFYPKASLLYGQSGDNVKVLRPFFKKTLIINLLVIVPVIVVLYLIIEPVAFYLLPKYVEGVEYAKLALIGGLGYIMVGPSIILGVIKKTGFNFSLLIMLSLLSYGAYFFQILNFDSIFEILWFKNILFIVYAFSLLLYIHYKLK